LNGAQIAAEERFDDSRLAFAAQQETHLRARARNIDQQRGRFRRLKRVALTKLSDNAL
jgi:hypothetical protein